jgi:protein-tyrosine kinase
MSSIDRALTIREGAGAATAGPDTETRAPSSAALNRFSREEPSVDVPHPAPSARNDDTSQPILKDGSRLKTIRPPRSRAVDHGLRARLVNTTSNAVSVEQYRRLAAVLHEAQEQSQLKSVMLTSALPGDGKTLTAANLALTLSESYGRRVLLIDADLRLPTLHTVLGISNDAGLSEALRGDQLACVEFAPGLAVLTAGKPGPTPLAGLSSNRMRHVVHECEERFDWVIIDTSPVGVLPDAQVIGRLVDAVLLVIGAGSTPAESVEHAIAQLGGADSIFGVVLNRVEESRMPQANYSSYYDQYRPAQE